MTNSREQAIERARKDLAARLGVAESQIAERTVENADFPDMSLGAPLKNEMSAQMITSGWRIRLETNNKTYEYRADAEGNDLRLFQFNGANFII